jgi:hypothetical protein
MRPPMMDHVTLGVGNEDVINDAANWALIHLGCVNLPFNPPPPPLSPPSIMSATPQHALTARFLAGKLRER